MLKLNQKGFSGLELVLAIAMTALLVGGGVYVYSQRHAAETKTAQEDVKTAPQKSEKVLSEDEQILQAAKCSTSSSCEIKDKQSNLAHVVASSEGGGGHIFLAKETGQWNIIFEGNGDVPDSTVQRYHIPQDWLGPQL